MPDSDTPLRANVYLDGFNFYYGCFKNPDRPSWSKYKWLDLAEFVKKTYPAYSINRIRYFTAPIQEDPSKPGQLQRQLTYLRALRTIENLSVHEGRFARTGKWKRVAVPYVHPLQETDPAQTAYVIIDEEKKSDVNLATYLVADAYEDEFDVAIVVSNDSDLAEPIILVRTRLQKRVELLNPRSKFAADLARITDRQRRIRLGPLESSQFPHTLSDEHGQITIPSEWLHPTEIEEANG